MRTLILLLLMTLFATAATRDGLAQSGFSNSTYTYLNGINQGTLPRTSTSGQDGVVLGVGVCNTCTQIGATLPLSAFASAQDLASTNAAIGRNRGLMLQGVALASAFNVTPPNPGARFSLNFGSAAFQGEAAGSVSVAWRLLPRAMLYTGVAQSSGQTLVKGGMSFSLQ